MAWGVPIFVCFLCLVQCSFREELLLRPLPGGAIASHFQFTSTLNVTNGEQFDHFSLFPKAMGQIIRDSGLTELHLTLTQGRWLYDLWGHAPFPAPVGAELWALFNSSQAGTDLDAAWARLSHQLSGLFCASLNRLAKSPHCFHPKHSMRPSSDPRFVDPKYSRYGTIPSEAACTENLTPWLKFLPCAGKSGLSSLLEPRKIYSSVFSSMGVHVHHVCSDPDCTHIQIQLVQTLTTVSRPRGSYETVSQVSLESLYMSNVDRACPLATQSTLYVETSAWLQEKDLELTPKAPLSIVSSSGTKLSTYDISKISSPFSLKLRWSSPQAVADEFLPQLSVSQFLTGYSTESGGVVLQLVNRRPHDVSAVVLQSLPWFLMSYLHTFSVTSNGVPAPSLVSKQSMKPAVSRRSPQVVELALTVPANAVVALSIDFEKAFLHIDEFPPDAHRGFDVGAALVTLLETPSESIRSSEWTAGGLFWSASVVTTPQERKIYTQCHLVQLPTPDFSMPYNVITLTCTVMALFFGSIFNSLTKKFNQLKQNPPIVRAIKFVVDTARSFVKRPAGEQSEEAGRKSE